MACWTLHEQHLASLVNGRANGVLGPTPRILRCTERLLIRSHMRLLLLVHGADGELGRG